MDISTFRHSAGVPQEAEELMSLAEREPIDEALQFLDPERLADARAGGGFAWGVTGHGVMSWVFRLVARTNELDLDLARPALRVLADEDTQAKIAADIRSACRLAALACCRAKSGRIGRLVVRSESAESWAWCVARENLFRVGDTFDELVDLLAADDDGIDPLLADYA